MLKSEVLNNSLKLKKLKIMKKLFINKRCSKLIKRVIWLKERNLQWSSIMHYTLLNKERIKLMIPINLIKLKFKTFNYFNIK